jgi:hypothetical protein
MARRLEDGHPRSEPHSHGAIRSRPTAASGVSASFDLYVWHENEPFTATDARTKLERWGDGSEHAFVTDPAVGLFYDALMDRFPPLESLSDDDIDETAAGAEQNADRQRPHAKRPAHLRSLAGPKTNHEQRVAAQSSRSFRVLALANVKEEWIDQARDIDVLVDRQVTRGSTTDRVTGAAGCP